MYLMRAAAWIDGGGDPYWRFYWVNVVILLTAALTTTVLLDRMGAQTALFAAAPTLALFGTMNWDLVAVAMTTGATYMFLRGRDGWAGVLLGVGMVVKLYPALVIMPMMIDRARGNDREGAVRLGVTAAGVLLLLNLPFALAAPTQWWNFFRYSSERDADGSTLWRIVCESVGCAPRALENLAPLVLTAVVGALVWRAATRRDPGTPRWTMAFPLLVLFLVTGKVWSSQYILWLLPWFALTAPTFRPYLYVQAAEVLVFITSFSFLARDQLGEGVPYPAVAATVVLRVAALVWCLVTWVRVGHRGPLGAAALPAESIGGRAGSGVM
jgi:uncharacterized membrane protein